jgi:hypothetical protein
MICRGGPRRTSSEIAQICRGRGLPTGQACGRAVGAGSGVSQGQRVTCDRATVGSCVTDLMIL